MAHAGSTSRICRIDTGDNCASAYYGFTAHIVVQFDAKPLTYIKHEVWAV